MSFYYLYFFYSSLHIFFENLKNKYFVNLLLLYLSLITLFFFSIRNEVGGDWFQYLDIFNNSNYKFNQDIGFFLLLKFLNLLHSDYFTLNFLISFIFLLGNYFFLKTLHNKFTIWVFFTPYFYFIVSMGYLRQALAIGLILIALFFIRGKYFKTSIMLLSISSLFHSTAIVLLPVFILTFIKNIKFNMFIIFFLLILLMIIILFFIFQFNSFYYKIYDYIINPTVSSSGTIFRAPIIILSSIFILYFFDFTKKSKVDIVYKYYAIYSILLIPLFFLSTTILDRIYLYFYPMVGFFINEFILSFDKIINQRLIKLLVVCISFIFLYVWLNFADNKSGWIPFSIIF